MSSATGYEFKIFILIVSSGILCTFSVPQLIIGVYKIWCMRKLNPPKAIFWSSLLSLFAAYLVMFTIFILSIFANYIHPQLQNTNNDNHNHNQHLTGVAADKHDDLHISSGNKMPLLLGIGISIVEFLFIISKFGVNFLFLCRLYYCFKDTLFHYTIYKLLPLFILILIELIIYILFSDIIIIHFVNGFEFKTLNKIFLTSYHCIDMILRIIFILLFERGLYRLATSRSFKSNLRLFGFGGASIDQIELSCKQTTQTQTNNTQLKDQVNKSKNDSDNSNYLHPLEYQNTDRADKFTLAAEGIPEGNECEESDNINGLDLDDTGFHFIADDEEDEQHANNMDTPTNISLVSFQSVHSNTITNHTYKLDVPACIQEDEIDAVIEEKSKNNEVNTGKTSISHRSGRSSSQINDLLSMSQMGHGKKRSSFALYFNSSSFDPHTKDLVRLVTKFSVLVVWSTVTSIFAAVFFISFVFGFNDNEILQNISSFYIALIICFVEMHIVYLQLNGTEKWYKCLCSLCHNAWGKCCVCKLRHRLVRKIGKQHKALALKEQTGNINNNNKHNNNNNNGKD